MKSPSKLPKSLITALVFTLIVIMGFKFCLPPEEIADDMIKTETKFVHKKKPSTKKVLIKRSISSVQQTQKNTLIPPHSQSIELVKKKYFSFLPKHIKWSVIPVANTNKGQQVKVRLEDSLSGKKTSYHALVENDSGKILTTWHRQIQH